MRKTDEQRFREKVKKDKSGCWLWTGRVDHRGYGRFFWQGRDRPAHYYTLMKAGRPVPKNRETHHICQKRNCVKPADIEILTHAEHMKIHAKSGIWAGSRNSQSKYNDVTVMTIKVLSRIFMIPAKWLSKKTAAPLRTCYYLGSKKGWQHLEPEFKKIVKEGIISGKDKKDVFFQAGEK